MTQDQLPILRPTIPGCVHGIVGVNPWEIQCESCGTVFTSVRLFSAVRLCHFSKEDGFTTRRCRDCRVAAGFGDS